MAEPARSMIVLWPGRDGWWGWTFKDASGTEVVANRLFRSREDALEAAERAYPGVAVEKAANGVSRSAVPRGALAAAGVIAAAVMLRRLRRRAIRVRRVGGG